MPYKDKNDPRIAETRKRWYESNKTRQLEFNRTHKRHVKDWVSELKDKPCTDCGGRFPPVVMDFDHLPEFEKVDSISVMANHGASKKRILDEIEKCEIVCANCHRIRTAERE